MTSDEPFQIVSKANTSTTILLLTQIWQRVLQLSSVGVEDNFFDLGGDSALALELFHEVALACGRDLPPVMIYHAPTISSLAAVLDQPTAPRVPALLQLKPGDERQPVFIAHGLGGSAMDFYQIVKLIDAPNAIHGLQAKGIDGADAPLETIEEMARYSLDSIKTIQPHGPYLLVGFSLGGLVTLEMAQQLLAQGEQVALLSMLDSYPHATRLTRSQRFRLSLRQTWRRAARRLHWLGVPPPFETLVDASASPALQRSRASAYRALERYQPRFYPGTITFVRAAIPTDFPADAAAVWKPLAHNFALENVPGDHLAIMTTNFEALAAALTRQIRQASSSD